MNESSYFLQAVNALTDLKDTVTDALDTAQQATRQTVGEALESAAEWIKPDDKD